MDLTEHLFRQESGRLVAALIRVFGIHNLPLVEDVVQDTLRRALEVWKFHGLPANPSAWLTASAKHRAIDVLRRERTARTFAPELGRLLDSEWTLVPSVEQVFEPHAIPDDLLRMMFSCCHPRLAEEVQVALVLRLLCGFSVGEIAAAFLSSEAAVEKRIVRGKQTLAASKRLFDVGDVEETSRRLPVVQRALYLLFNEGYHGASPESAVRMDLCREAMRLCALLLAHRHTANPASHALLALMCLHAARLPARVDPAGALSSLANQDRTRWDEALIKEGQRLLDLSASGTELTDFHLEAAIAGIHASASTPEDTNWEEIVSLYDRLLALRPSPVVALNRAIAIAQLEGPARGLEELHALPEADRQRLSSYPFYAAALGEMELELGSLDGARAHFQRALGLARNGMERQFFEQRLGRCVQ